MDIKPSSSPMEPEKLKPVLHEKIERMDREHLLLLDRILLQIEAEERAGKLAEAFDQDLAQGKFDRISEAIRSFRSAHGYA